MRTDRAVTVRPFREDDDDVEAFLAAIIERLDPMDPLQRSLALRIAGIHLKTSRLEIYGAVALRCGTRLPAGAERGSSTTRRSRRSTRRSWPATPSRTSWT